MGVSLIDATADLLFQGACPGCGLPGHGICALCRRAVMSGSVGPRERVGIDVPLWSAGDYTEPLPRVISGAKDHHTGDVIDLLGVRLAFAVAGLADAARPAGPGVLVPFPSSAATVRERGLDVTFALARSAARRLGRVGLVVTVRPLLTHARAVRDQGRLSSEERYRNLAGSLRARDREAAGWIILVDDVVTTGASLREGIRALRSAGITPAGAATIGATILRHDVRPGAVRYPFRPTQANV